jgi:hypothetical protein
MTGRRVFSTRRRSFAGGVVRRTEPGLPDFGGSLRGSSSLELHSRRSRIRGGSWFWPIWHLHFVSQRGFEPCMVFSNPCRGISGSSTRTFTYERSDRRGRNRAKPAKWTRLVNTRAILVQRRFTVSRTARVSDSPALPKAPTATLRPTRRPSLNSPILIRCRSTSRCIGDWDT